MRLPRLGDTFRYGLERMMIRGPHYQLLLVALVIGLISLVGGVVVRAGTGDFHGMGEATWWAFLRLTDPGYLGDDEGVLRRVVSTTLTVLGYVVFLGALIAIMTRWLLDLMRRLESGVSPVAATNHIVIIGWTARTATLVGELLASQGRVQRFLQRRGARRLRVVILAEEVGPALVQELHDRAPAKWNPRQVTLRSGSSLRPDHLERTDFVNSAVILVPAQDRFDMSIEAVDSCTIKTLLSLGNHPLVRAGRTLPLAVAEVRDARKIPIARQAYDGEIEVVASDATISRLIAQNVRHRGLSHVYNELLTHSEGSEIYIRSPGTLLGRPFEKALAAFGHAILLGIVRPSGRSFTTHLNPPADLLIERDDRLVVLAGSYEDAAPGAGDSTAAAEPPVVRGQTAGSMVDGPGDPMRVLILGWSPKMPALMAEFGTYEGDRFAIDMVSVIPTEDRERMVERYGGAFGNVTLRHLDADYNHLPELQALEPWTYDQVILVGSGITATDEDADARALQGYLLLQQLFAGRDAKPSILIELLDPENSTLLAGRPGEVLISPMILSHILAQVALRRELRAVFDEFFTAGGAEIAFRPIEAYGLAGQDATFAQMQRAAWEKGEIAIGIFKGGGEVAGARPVLNPRRDTSWRLEPGDELVTIITYD